MKTTIDSFKLLIKNKNIFFTTTVFDVLFLVFLLSLKVISDYFAKSLIFTADLPSLIMYVLLTLLYYTAIISIYSFFSMQVLKKISSVFREAEGRKFMEVFSMNMVVVSILSVIYISLAYFVSGLKENILNAASLIAIVVFVLIFYVMLSSSQNVFWKGSSMKETIKSSFKSIIAKKQNMILLQSFIIIAFIAILFNFAYILLRVQQNSSQSLILEGLFLLFSYILFSANRISFYRAAIE